MKKLIEKDPLLKINIDENLKEINDLIFSKISRFAFTEDVNF
jgi:hypothetical protein